MSRSQLKSIARLPLPPLSSKASKLFGASKAEIQQVSKLRTRLEPTRLATKSALHGSDAKLGFRLAKVQTGTYKYGSCSFKVKSTRGNRSYEERSG